MLLVVPATGNLGGGPIFRAEDSMLTVNSRRVRMETMYGKLFASLYQGTLRGCAHEILVFTNLIAHADREGFVDKHPRAIAEEVGLSIGDVRAALTKLEAPDPESRTPDEEGRRIVRIDDHRAWGWRIVNAVKYRDIRNEEERREQFRVAQRKRRQRMSTAVNTGQRPSTLSTHTEVDASTDTTTEAIREVATQPPVAAAPGAAVEGTIVARARKPVTEHDGLVGELARAWALRHPELGAPTWGRECTAVNKLAQAHGPEAVRTAWGAYLEDDWQGNDGHPVKGFVARFDTWRARSTQAQDPISRLSPAGRKTAEAARRVAARMQAAEDAAKEQA